MGDHAILCLARLDSNFKNALFPEIVLPEKTEKKLKRSRNVIKIVIKVCSSSLQQILKDMADDWGFDLIQPVYVAELIPSKDFLETEAEMFPAPKLESRAVKDTNPATSFLQSVSSVMCC